MAGIRRLLACVLAYVGTAGPATVVPLGPKSELHVCSDSILRIVHRPTLEPLSKVSLIARADWDPVAFTTKNTSATISVTTAQIEVAFSVADGSITFRDRFTGTVLLTEASHSFTPVQDIGRDTFQVEQSWLGGADDEGLYGGGEYQNGFLNFKNAPIEMVQSNTQAVVPYFWSTSGYGVLWDNYAWTYLNPPHTALVPQVPTGTSGSATFTPVADGDHFFYIGKSAPKAGETPGWNQPGPNLVVSLVDPNVHTIVVQDWAFAANYPTSLTGVARGLRKGTAYRVNYAWSMSDAGLFVQGPEYGRTTLRSAVGDVIDYYFVAAKTGHEAIVGYRTLTGAAPLYGKWVYGFWQCKEHYDSQAELLAAAHGFRSRGLPLDAIVQDWFYWGPLGWGPHWDLTRYPDPAGMVKELKSLDMHFMISVWSKFDEKTNFYQEMSSKGWLLGGSNVYDAWNPSARELFYNFSKAAHFSIGVDALWLDATEPEDLPNMNTHTFAGTGNYLMNSYSLMTTQAIADGLRRDYPDAQGARVFSLTRSAFAGQQRTGAALWSGDTSATWDVLRRQVAASINYQMSGIPYWSEDIGGFFRPKDQYDSLAYHDLLIRWFQFGAFTPIFRVHGAGTNTELWNFGESTMQTINASAVSLRYRLLPYIYSGFARVEIEGYTMQRGLPMDFGADPAVRNIADQFMFGDAFMVTPIHSPTVPNATAPPHSQREAYFPKGTSWVNFHTGKSQLAGHAQVTFELTEAPAFVRAGSIVALGPLLQHSGEWPADPLEVRVYGGADAEFALFEDDGLSRGYQGGARTIVHFAWLEARRELNIGARMGSFEGMLSGRTFHIVFVSAGHGVGVLPCLTPDKVLHYDGSAVTVSALANTVELSI